VQKQDGRDVVLVVQNGRAERRAIAISSAQDKEVMLSAGVTAGEKVIVNPSAEVIDGARVKEITP
jgi:endo-beta-N-acetylglucosaminidase D